MLLNRIRFRLQPKRTILGHLTPAYNILFSVDDHSDLVSCFCFTKWVIISFLSFLHLLLHSFINILTKIKRVRRKALWCKDIGIAKHIFSSDPQIYLSSNCLDNFKIQEIYRLAIDFHISNKVDPVILLSNFFQCSTLLLIFEVYLVIWMIRMTN